MDIIFFLNLTCSLAKKDNSVNCNFHAEWNRTFLGLTPNIHLKYLVVSLGMGGVGQMIRD